MIHYLWNSMPNLADLLEDPAVIRSPAFDPRNYSVLDIALGAPESSLDGWNASAINEVGWRSIDGGIGVRIRNGFILEIKPPGNFLSRAGIQPPGELFQVFGPPDSIDPIVYRGCVTHARYIWNRGWWVLCDQRKEAIHHLVIFDPTNPWVDEPETLNLAGG